MGKTNLAVRIALALASTVAPAVAGAQTSGTDSVVYEFSPASQLDVRTGKAGLLGFAGHEHLIRARVFSGRVIYHPAGPAASRFEIVIQAGGLEVLTPPDTEEIRKVTAALRTDVLDAASYPEIRFASRSVALREGRAHVVGALTIKGQTRDVPIDAQVEIGRDTLRATATFAIKQTDFGIRPYRGGPGGTVRVADKMTFEIRAVAIRDGL
ncbi:MAG TPA: YceI family protein [Gemmatimonadales bacterium]|jgi:polyisoprenoid-binding protein YceI